MIGDNHPVIREVESILRNAGVANASDEASRIVTSVARHPDPGTWAVRAMEIALERAKGIPLAYLTGTAPFMGLHLLTAPGALVPRDETELLGRTAVDLLSGLGHASPRLIDMCCGTGNLACGIAHHHPALRVWASDLTEDAVAIARANVEVLGLADRIVVVRGDLFTALSGFGLEGSIDVVVCNPPYISSGRLARDRADLLAHEPREAFDGGPYGVSIFQRVVRDAAAFLKPDGFLLFEIGLGQERQISMIFERTRRYRQVSFVNDRGGDPRVVIGRLISARD